MAITLNSGRQEVIGARVVVSLGTGNDVSAIGTYPAVQVPAGAVVVGGYVNVTDATDATVDLNLGDGGSATRYASAVDGAATGLTALTVTGYKYPVADTIDLGIATLGASAAGEVEIYVEYVVDGRAAFSQG